VPPYDPVPCDSCGACFNWHDAAPGETTPCPSCGESVAVPLDPPPHPIPWEDGRLSVFKRWWRTFDRAIFSPVSFFRSIPYEGGHRKPLRFVVFYFILFWGLMAVAIPLYMIRSGRPDRAWFGIVFSLVMAPLASGVVVALLYLQTAIDHVCLRILGGKGSFEATLRVVAYSYPTTLARTIPVVGKFVHLAWSLLCFTCGFAAAHRISKTRAFIAGFLGTALAFGLFVLAGMFYTLVLPLFKKL